MRTAPTRPVPHLLLILGLLAVALAAPTGTARGAAAEETPAEAGTAPPTLDHARAERMAQRMWWHRDAYAESLQLRPAQQERMDGLFVERTAERREVVRRMTRTRHELGTLLGAGDWPAAEDKAQEVASLSAELSRLQSALTLDVLRELSAAQRETLAREHPALLMRPWMVGGRRVIDSLRVQPRGGRGGG